MYLYNSSDNGTTWNSEAYLTGVALTNAVSVEINGTQLLVIYENSGTSSTRGILYNIATKTTDADVPLSTGNAQKLMSTSLDVNGNLLVLYWKVTGLTFRSFYTGSGSFDIIRTVNIQSTYNPTFATIFADDNNIHVLESDELGNDLNYYNSTDSGVTWSSAVSITTDNADPGMGLVDSNNVIHSCYTFINGSVAQLNYAKSVDGGSSWNIQKISSDVESVGIGFCKIAREDNNSLVLTYHDDIRRS